MRIKRNIEILDEEDERFAQMQQQIKVTANANRSALLALAEEQVAAEQELLQVNGSAASAAPPSPDVRAGLTRHSSSGDLPPASPAPVDKRSGKYEITIDDDLDETVLQVLQDATLLGDVRFFSTRSLPPTLQSRLKSGRTENWEGPRSLAITMLSRQRWAPSDERGLTLALHEMLQELYVTASFKLRRQSPCCVVSTKVECILGSKDSKDPSSVQLVLTGTALRLREHKPGSGDRESSSDSDSGGEQEERGRLNRSVSFPRERSSSAAAAVASPRPPRAFSAGLVPAESSSTHPFSASPSPSPVLDAQRQPSSSIDTSELRIELSDTPDGSPSASGTNSGGEEEEEDAFGAGFSTPQQQDEQLGASSSMSSSDSEGLRRSLAQSGSVAHRTVSSGDTPRPSERKSLAQGPALAPPAAPWQLSSALTKLGVRWSAAPQEAHLKGFVVEIRPAVLRPTPIASLSAARGLQLEGDEQQPAKAAAGEGVGELTRPFAPAMLEFQSDDEAGEAEEGEQDEEGEGEEGEEDEGEEFGSHLDSRFQTYASCLAPSTTSATIVDLQPAVDYEVRVVAVARDGSREAGKPALMATAREGEDADGASAPPVQISSLAFVPGQRVVRYRGRLSLHFIKENTGEFEREDAEGNDDGFGRFTALFLAEVRTHCLADSTVFECMMHLQGSCC